MIATVLDWTGVFLMLAIVSVAVGCVAAIVMDFLSGPPEDQEWEEWT